MKSTISGDIINRGRGSSSARKTAVVVCLLVVLAGCQSVLGRSSRPTSQATSIQAASQTAVLEAVASAANIRAIPSDVTPALQLADADSGQSMAGSVGCNPGFNQTKTPACIFGDPNGSKTLILYGDSHASMWLPAFNAIGKRLHWRIALLAKYACSAPELNFGYWNGQFELPYAQCNTWHKYALARANALHAQVVVVTSEFYTSRLSNNQPVTPSEWSLGLRRTLAAFKTPGIIKIVLGDIPYLAQDGASCLAAHESDIRLCSRNRAAAVLTSHDNAERSAAIAEGAKYISVVSWFCSSVCTAIVGNMVVNQDQYHITKTYAIYLSGVLQTALLEAMSSS
jgi:SGNH domain (fused to AT3 domains)